ncbi:MAG: hypothetical protein GX214_06470 [Clostridiales bacterium]|nr:hypothetical protein [Clostridiales bacterium]
MKLSKLFNTNIKISPMFIPIFIISFHYNRFYELLIILTIIFIHEISHSIVSIYYNMKIVEIEFFPFGAIAKTESFFELNPTKEIIISIAGPISNIIMLFMSILIKKIMSINSDLMIFFIQANLGIGLFNMLPILPLDGGRILRAYLNIKTDIKKSTHITVRISKIIILLMFFYSIFMNIKYNNRFFLSGVTIFLYFKVRQEKYMMDYTLIYQIIIKKKKLIRKGIMDVKCLTALENIPLNNVFKRFSSSKYHLITVIDNKGRILGNISESEILDAMIEYDTDMTLKILMEVLGKRIE